MVVLRKRGLERAGADRCLFIGRFLGVELWLYAHVDDFHVSVPRGRGDIFRSFFASLRDDLIVREMPADSYLGIRVRRDWGRGTISLDQAEYARGIVRRLGLEGCSPTKTPLPVGLLLSRADAATTDAERAAVAAVDPRKVLGELAYLARQTRFDLLHAVGYLCRFTAFAGPMLLTAIKHLCRYVAGTLDSGVVYSREGNRSPVGWADSDHAGDLDTRRSTSGTGFWLAGAPIIAQSKLQACVALSSTQAEYQATSAACRDALWLRQLLADLGRAHLVRSIPLRVDNEGAIALAHNHSHHDRVKHYDVQHHFVRELVQQRTIQIVRTRTADNVVDLLTKPLPIRDFERHRPAFVTPLGR